MWTHKRPYQLSRLTRKSIHYHGAVGLYRALNIGRLVAFVGSGVTVAYGRPTWQKLVESAYDYIKLQYKGKPGGKTNDQIEYIAWLGLGDPKDADRTAINGLEDLWATLKSFYDTHARSEHQDGESLKVILEICENMAQTMDLYARRVGKRSFVAAGLRQHICSTLTHKPTHERDPIAQIHEDLRIRRLLTVNYDVEIERYLQERNGFSSPPLTGKDIATLLGAQIKPILGEFPPRKRDTRHHPMFKEQPAHLVARDNLGRMVASTRLTETSVADLIAFATIPRPYESQVFHLHGRLDDPKSLIVTEGDYQRTYLTTGPKQRAFQEALDTLFLGNDVLFVGLGMNEADLLRPLRQFVVTDSLADVEARRIFALLPFTGEQRATAQALDLKIRCGVQAYFFGEGLNWFMRDALQRIWTCVQHVEERRARSQDATETSGTFAPDSEFARKWDLTGTSIDDIYELYQNHGKDTEESAEINAGQPKPSIDYRINAGRKEFEAEALKMLPRGKIQNSRVADFA